MLQKLHLPRLAIGTINQSLTQSPLMWSLLHLLRQRGLENQAFWSRACLADDHILQDVVGRSPRHLDSWLMGHAESLYAFHRGSQSADIGTVLGEMDSWRATHSTELSGGSLDKLAEWLDLPRIVIIDVSKLSRCQLPMRPPGVSAVLLDRVSSREEIQFWTLHFKALWQTPVLGGLIAPELAHRPLDVDAFTTRYQLDQAANQLAENLNLIGLLEAAQQGAMLRRLAQRPEPAFVQRKLNVALAMDDAFQSYFPDALEMLESHANLHYFSPLRDDHLPPETDVVYLGGGPLDAHVGRLSTNFCMHQAIHAHVNRGRRVYAEGSGAAYLCQSVRLPGNQLAPMAGVLPAGAVMAPQQSKMLPVEVRLRGRMRETRLRGYLNPNWSIRPQQKVTKLARRSRNKPVVISWRGVVASQLHLHLATQPALLPAFFQTAQPKLHYYG